MKSAKKFKKKHLEKDSFPYLLSSHNILRVNAIDSFTRVTNIFQIFLIPMTDCLRILAFDSFTKLRLFSKRLQLLRIFVYLFVVKKFYNTRLRLFLENGALIKIRVIYVLGKVYLAGRGT